MRKASSATVAVKLSEEFFQNGNNFCKAKTAFHIIPVYPCHRAAVPQKWSGQSSPRQSKHRSGNVLRF